MRRAARRGEESQAKKVLHFFKESREMKESFAEDLSSCEFDPKKRKKNVDVRKRKKKEIKRNSHPF